MFFLKSHFVPELRNKTPLNEKLKADFLDIRPTFNNRCLQIRFFVNNSSISLIRELYCETKR